MKVKKTNNTAEVRKFLDSAGKSLETFRYFQKRPIEIIKNHLATFVIEHNEEIIGYGHLEPEGSKIWLGICITEKMLGKGLGKLLISKMIDESKHLNVKEVTLSVDNNNLPAIRLYESFDFKKVSINHDYMLMNKILNEDQDG